MLYEKLKNDVDFRYEYEINRSHSFYVKFLYTAAYVNTYVVNKAYFIFALLLPNCDLIPHNVTFRYSTLLTWSWTIFFFFVLSSFNLVFQSHIMFSICFISTAIVSLNLHTSLNPPKDTTSDVTSTRKFLYFRSVDWKSATAILLIFFLYTSRTCTN